MAAPIDNAVGYRVGDELVEREIDMDDGDCRNVVANAERLHLPGQASDLGQFALQLDDEFVLHRHVAPPADHGYQCRGPTTMTADRKRPASFTTCHKSAILLCCLGADDRSSETSPRWMETDPWKWMSKR